MNKLTLPPFLHVPLGSSSSRRSPHSGPDHRRTLGFSALLLGLIGLGHAAAAVTLRGVDCARQSDVRCTLKSGNTGRIGSGLPFKLGGFEFLGSGYIDAASNSVIVPLEIGSQQDNQGVVMRVDLLSGDRSVISGYDGEQTRGKGVAYVSDRGYPSEAYDLGRVMVVRPGPGGTIIALVDKGLQSRTELIRIDPGSGDRTLLWASKVFPDAAPSGPAAIRDIEQARFHLGSASLCASDDRVGLKPASVFETDGQNAYLMLVNNPSGSGSGLVKVPLQGGKCSWISEYFPDGSSPIGSGPTINTLSPLVFASGLLGQEFLAATGPNPSGNTLFGIDTQSGARRTLSANNVQSPGRGRGGGDPLGYLGALAVGSAGIATARPGADSLYFEPVLVNPQTGDRRTSPARSGSLKDGRDGNYAIVAAIPGSSSYVVAFGGALHIWNAESGDSYVLSQ